ncbi:hypothetical protein SMACR_01073 [Sordaria macrospora]|uniref:WGS project CABT00000000 data, contig 2.2 n=2 Tax=Sordaria macrospora TaxID=5147 RepID=F7VNX0_SORMK|nr:uncharacterized protein SMAC_01073 [Sordaria macrospora k-hell]KAA8629354.1 hypothetical protein SMACR_01073 [Sordaria macrospora]KAH7630553.1 hypothetical protein B0T09DRAFT_121836 [Sordaria sp. MPI-SDFR-AT-0083]WPJ62314.1 hypothetical protein SMAC4_01073 [Sordaria macrospora]CCC07049.1 unnamed protein product [Sordaria macrospora k-hell]
MFKRSFRSRDAGSSQREPAQKSTSTDSQHRVDKSARLTKKSKRDLQKLSNLKQSLTGEHSSHKEQQSTQAKPAKEPLVITPAPIITITVGSEGRLFAAHEDILCQAALFERMLRGRNQSAQPKRILLEDEEPEVFSAILEYLYKGDYYPRLLYNQQQDSWELEDSLSIPAASRAAPLIPPTGNNSPQQRGGGRAGQGPSPSVEPTVFLSSLNQYLLRDTVVYCAAERYGLEELKKLALRKQGLQTGIDVSTILRSAQYCYAHTPDSDSRLRAHYLALIIRCRKTFKRSGTMQAEMEKAGSSNLYGQGSGKLFFDLFVAMCNHLDDVIELSNAATRGPQLLSSSHDDTQP